MVRWLKQEDFWSEHDEATPLVRIDHQGWCRFQVSYAALRTKIGSQEPNRDVSGEVDPAGPVSRWYGILEGVPVLLDYHHSHPEGEVVVLQHGDQPGSRDVVRKEFASWCDRWMESS